MCTDPVPPLLWAFPVFIVQSSSSPQFPGLEQAGEIGWQEPHEEEVLSPAPGSCHRHLLPETWPPEELQPFCFTPGMEVASRWIFALLKSENLGKS